MEKDKLAEMSINFAVDVLKMTEGLQGHYSIKNQLERSATSIGANIREAKYAQSKLDFINKLQVSLKECYETEYWLEILERTNMVSKEEMKAIWHDCGAIRRMLICSINTVKSNLD